ncbi:hypothetical protein QE152_g25884 [Popillia japonica]|uniref:Uncharacterized protein n=1 Tax=Popillia japonica TaxID=7064 RepID=A0AAW1K038_POPJA
MSKDSNIQDDVNQNKILKAIIEITNQQTNTLRCEIADYRNNKSTDEYFESHLNVDLSASDINDIYAIGKQTTKPIIVKFISYLKKKEVLKNVRQLKGTKIVVAEDLIYEDRQRNRILRKHLLAARSKLLNAFIKANKLYVNGEAFTADQLIEKESEDSLHVSIEKRSNSAPPTPTPRVADFEDLALDNNDTIASVVISGESSPKSSFSISDVEPRKLRSNSVSGTVQPGAELGGTSGKPFGPSLRKQAALGKPSRDKK